MRLQNKANAREVPRPSLQTVPEPVGEALVFYPLILAIFGDALVLA